MWGAPPFLVSGELPRGADCSVSLKAEIVFEMKAMNPLLRGALRPGSCRAQGGSLPSGLEGVGRPKLSVGHEARAGGGHQGFGAKQDYHESQPRLSAHPDGRPEWVTPFGPGFVVRRGFRVLPDPVGRLHAMPKLQIPRQGERQEEAQDPGLEAGGSPAEIDPFCQEMRPGDSQTNVLEHVQPVPEHEPCAGGVRFAENPAGRCRRKERAHRHEMIEACAEPHCGIHHPDEAQERDHRPTLGAKDAAAKPRFERALCLVEPTAGRYAPPIQQYAIILRSSFRRIWLACLILLLSARGGEAADGPAASRPPSTNGVIVLAIEGVREKAEIQRMGSGQWDRAYEGQVLKPGDQGRLGDATRLTLRLSDLSIMRIGESSEFTITEPPGAGTTQGFSLWRGLLYLFHRDAPGSTRIQSRSASAATRGTEFLVEVDPSGDTFTLSVLAGEGELSNDQGRLMVRPGERATAQSGSAPRPSPRLESHQLIQWVLYYPAVLADAELPLMAEERARLEPSLAEYRAGDLSAALSRLPSLGAGLSYAERVYRAALFLSVGQTRESEALLSAGDGSDPTLSSLASSLRGVMAAVRDAEPRAQAADAAPVTATAWLAEAFRFQALRQLDSARAAAQRAVDLQPRFGFAWARLCELEMSFGRWREAGVALDHALALSPRNAQAHALRGFLEIRGLSSSRARAAFEEALRLDGALSSAWMGRGLLKIHSGDREGGREDLQVAASLEPHRGILRSYLGKAWQESRDPVHARSELELAKELDPSDPTAWLYSALVNLNQNRLNQAVRDLEQSKRLNDNRAVYRSGLLLDQDRAVRGANLAGAYQAAGLGEVAVAEAGRAMASDYANYSAHLFLADTYNALRDPRQINQRYETAWLSEYLMANLLSPAAAGAISQTLGEQDYARFFERNRVGFVSSSKYLSRGDWIQSAAQYGRFDRFSYAAEMSYRSEQGDRPNEESTTTQVSVQFKQEISSRDSLYVQTLYSSSDQGDLTPHYSPTDALAGFKVKERQEPLLVAGYHREWSPGSHSLLLVGRLTDELTVRSPRSGPFTLASAGGLPVAIPTVTDATYRSEFEAYTAEWQQILERGAHTWVAGARAQFGQVNARNDFTSAARLNGLPFPQTPNPAATEVGAGFERYGIYLYDHWKLSPTLTIVPGIALDHLRYPLNFRQAPLRGGTLGSDLVEPKFGVVWTPRESTLIRGAISRSLSGVSFDQSFQLEPSQLAGFGQAFRSLIPEAVGNANSGAEMRAASVAWDQRIGSNTWAGVNGTWLESEVDRYAGAFRLSLLNGFQNDSVLQKLDYRERSAGVYVHRLIADEWSIGTRYRLTYSELEERHPELPSTAFPAARFSPAASSALLHQLRSYLQFQHPGGFFAVGESIWNRQHNLGYVPDQPGDDFWQFDVHVGYRWPNRRAEVRVGILNLTDRDYRMNPLSVTEVLPRDRTLAVSLRLNF